MFAMVAYGFIADSQSSNDRFLRLNFCFVNSAVLFLRHTVRRFYDEKRSRKKPISSTLVLVQTDTICDEEKPSIKIGHYDHPGVNTVTILT